MTAASSGGAECLIQIGEDIVDVLDPDAQSNAARARPRPVALGVIWRVVSGMAGGNFVAQIDQALQLA